MISATGKASHIPFIPQMRDMVKAQKIIAANPQSIVDYKAGKDRALGFLVGQCMKEMKGKGNPQILNKLILEELNK